MATVTLAEKAGFCFGVDRAIKLIEDLLSEGKRVATLGPIIHNSQVIEDLEKRGVSVVESPSQVEEGVTLVLRTHGVTKEVMDEVIACGCDYIDAACPFVKKIHKIVRENSTEDTVTFIAGDENHPEVKGIKSYAKGEAFVVESAEALENLAKNHPELCEKPAIFLSQTTFSVKEWEKSIKNFQILYTNSKLFATICYATEERQNEAALLSKKSDGMIVVGGRHSSNTRKLLAVCQKNCPSFLVETPQELYGINLAGFNSLGVTAGASTPAGIIKEVLRTMSEIVNENKMIEEDVVLDAVAESEDFAAMMEESLSNMSNDQKVVGIVMGITPTEIQVDIGRKQTGYIPYDEYSLDPNADPKAELKIGDALNLIIMKTNDQEGVTMLSKKKYDSQAAWVELADKAGTDTVYTGKVTKVVKGGVTVNINNVPVFVPASLATARRGDSLEALVNTEVSLKIIEVSEYRGRRKAVGSIRALLEEERKAAVAKFWESAAIGDDLTGKVVAFAESKNEKRVKYGVIVDLGGVTGMIHISELSWNRIRTPEEVVNIGDEVTVRIIGLDKESGKISLGYRRAEDNPWEIFKATYEVGSVVEVEIASCTDFGAFAHIIPGIDGLIHISQISNKRIEKASNELTVGEKVQAKITAVDYDRKRVSLSIRALLEPVEEAAEEAVAEEAASEE